MFRLVTTLLKVIHNHSYAMFPNKIMDAVLVNFIELEHCFKEHVVWLRNTGYFIQMIADVGAGYNHSNQLVHRDTAAKITRKEIDESE